MDSGTVGVIIVMGALVLWAVFSKRKQRGATRVVLVGRPVAPPSHVLKNIMVLAILGGLAWFFWWATHTKFWP